MSNAAVNWARRVTTGNPARKAVLMVLADYADEEWSCFPGQERLSTETELSTRTIGRALSDLEEVGLIRRARRTRGDGSRTSDRIYLQPLDAVGLTPRPPRPPSPPDTPSGSDDDPPPTGHSDQGNPTDCPSQPDTVSGHDPLGDPLVEPPENPLSSTTPPAPADAAPSEEVQQLCSQLADAVERYRDGAQGGRPKVTKAWERDMRLLLERGPLGAEQARAVPAHRVEACIAVVFRELADPQPGSGFCWAKNVQSPSALRRHWWQLYAAARDLRHQSQMGRLAPVVRAGSGDMTPLGQVLSEHASTMATRRGLPGPRPLPELGAASG
jgi:hypothetical protein